jgi:hypothetical protein
MTTGAHDPREVFDRRTSERRAAPRRTSDHSAADAIELEAIREAFDQELDRGERIPFETVARICQNFAAHLLARGGKP